MQKAANVVTRWELEYNTYGSRWSDATNWESVLTDITDPNSVADLNEGVNKNDRDYIVLYSGWEEREAHINLNAPITDICVVLGKSSDSTEFKDYDHHGNASWFLLAKDLNKKTDGDYVYLAWTYDLSRKPITKITITDNPAKYYPGWEVVCYKGSNTPADFNAGVFNGKMKAQAIYMVMAREK